MTDKQFVFLMASLGSIGYTKIEKTDKGVVVSGKNMVTREFPCDKELQNKVKRHGNLLLMSAIDYGMETIGLWEDLHTEDQKWVNVQHKPNKLKAFIPKDEYYIPTLNGIVKTNPGDWIVEGVNGEMYPCDPEIFKKLYDIVE